MKKMLVLLIVCLASSAYSQRPDRPLRPLNAYTLEGYQAIDVKEAFDLPLGMEFSSVAAVAINSVNNLIVLQRGSVPFMEFDLQGNFIRSFGAEDLFIRSHGLNIDEQDNLWVTDVNAHTVMKLNSDGEILFTLGTTGESGVWDETTGSHLFADPNDIAFDSAGNVYIAQGHGYTDIPPGVLKFSPEGEFISQWGKRGNGPAEMRVAHSIVIDEDDKVYVADRENHRIQIFSTSGNHLESWEYNTLVCALYLHDDGFMYITTGFDGELAKLNMNGTVLGAIGRPGSGNGEFGEGHDLVVDLEGNVYISDVINLRVQKFLKK